MSEVVGQTKDAHFDRGTAHFGFTLVELLVSMVVLVIVLLLCSEVLLIALKTWSTGRSQVDNFSKARVALDIIARDIQAAVIRSDLPSFFNPVSPTLIFYTKQQAFLASGDAGDRPLSRVYYHIVTLPTGSVLRRSAYGFNYGDDLGYSPATWAIPTTQMIDTDIGPGVLVMSYQFIDTTGLNILPANVNNAWSKSVTLPGVQDMRAMTISMAVLDNQNLAILINLGKLAQLQSNFSTTDPGSLKSFASAWQAQLDDSASPISAGGVPLPVLQGLKIVERTIMLPALTN